MLSESFSSGAPRPDFWSQISGQTFFAFYAGQANFLFFGNFAGPRFASTLAFDARTYQSLEFDLVYGDARNGFDPIDGNNDLIRLEYSIDNGASWQLIQAYTSPTVWTRFKVKLPSAAQTANTMFRWQQPANDGAGTDYWGLDNIELKTTTFTPPG